EAYPILDIVWLQSLFTIMASAGNIVFGNLPLIFAVGVAIGLARNDKGTAGLAAVLGFFVMHATINAILGITDNLAGDELAQAGQGMTVGIQSLETGVFGGIIVGIMTSQLDRKCDRTGDREEMSS